VTQVSTTPLASKRGIRPGSVVIVSRAPEGWSVELPPGATLRRRVAGRADVVLAFFTGAAPLRERVESLARVVVADGGLWIAWPKRSSGLVTDVTDHVARDVCLPLGLVDNKVCALDATWTALRFVWRVDRRT
jgi:hypothetical protein